MSEYQETNQFKDTFDLDNYLLAGNAVITLESPSGKHHTYLYSKPKNAEVFPDDVRFVYALHNGKKQFYLGMIEMDKFRLTRNSRFDYDTEIVKGAFYIEKLRLYPGFIDKSPMRVYHQGRCGKCGRVLTDPKSIKCGIGPHCRKKLGL